jgi:hypothetical protein
MAKPGGVKCFERALKRIVSGVTLSLCLTTSSCFTTNTYLVPDTLPPGQTTFTAAVDGWVFRRKYDVPGDPFPERHVDSTGFAVVPHVMARVGVVSRIDAGLDLGPNSPVRADVKVQLVEGDIGVAVAGVARYLQVQDTPTSGDASSGSLELPVIVGVHLTHELMIVASPGIVWMMGKTPKVPFTFSKDEAFTRAQYAQMAFGPVVELSPRFSLFPEVMWMRSLSGPVTSWITLGVGFVMKPRQKP